MKNIIVIKKGGKPGILAGCCMGVIMPYRF